ncbi:MAG TPA: four helix bundle protein [Gemmataceae bacterium]|nr:four helix bundle protein [Gemmataceae bacterium]
MAVRHFSDLIVWQKGMDLAEQVYRLTESFPRREMFGLSNQIRRASVSVPSNIAEGQGRSSTDDFLRFLYMAKGSLQELEIQAILSGRLKFLSEPDFLQLKPRIDEVARILNGLIASLCRAGALRLTTDH